MCRQILKIKSRLNWLLINRARAGARWCTKHAGLVDSTLVVRKCCWAAACIGWMLLVLSTLVDELLPHKYRTNGVRRGCPLLWLQRVLGTPPRLFCLPTTLNKKISVLNLLHRLNSFVWVIYKCYILYYSREPLNVLEFNWRTTFFLNLIYLERMLSFQIFE